MAKLQHRYHIGQNLLCFEPDTSKAKLIYFAKILKHVENTKSNIPHYMVHFQGWKCKWDREVPEHLLLENTEFNRTLKRKIDEIARHERYRTKRKQRIDMVLKAAALAGDNVDWDNVPGVWIPKQKRARTVSLLGCPQSPSDRTCSERAASTVSDDLDAELMDGENVTQAQFESLPFHRLFAPSVMIPDGLRAIIDAHCSGSLVGQVSHCTRGWCSVLQVLQSYVDNFPYEESQVPLSLIQVNCSDRVFRQLSPAYTRTDQSRLLCADVCSSLRVLFDCMLDRYLLLPEEHNLQSLISSNRFMCNGHAFPPGTKIPAEICPLYRYSSPRFELFPDPEADRIPDAPCLNYPAHFLLRLFVNLPRMIDTMNLTACRRTIVIRHLIMFLSYLDRTRNWWFAHAVPRQFELPSDTPGTIPSGSYSKGPHEPTKIVTGAPSESSSETEPQANAELVLPSSHRASSRSGTRRVSTSIDAVGISLPMPTKLDPFDDPVTAIKLPISQSITSPDQLELMRNQHVRPDPAGQARERHPSTSRSSTTTNTASTHHPRTSKQSGQTKRLRATVSNVRHSISAQSHVRKFPKVEQQSTVTKSPIQRALRPRLSNVQYKS